MRISDWSSDVCSSDLRRLRLVLTDPALCGGQPSDGGHGCLDGWRSEPRFPELCGGRGSASAHGNPGACKPDASSVRHGPTTHNSCGVRCSDPTPNNES